MLSLLLPLCLRLWIAWITAGTAPALPGHAAGRSVRAYVSRPFVSFSPSLFLFLFHTLFTFRFRCSLSQPSPSSSLPPPTISRSNSFIHGRICGAPVLPKYAFAPQTLCDSSSRRPLVPLLLFFAVFLFSLFPSLSFYMRTQIRIRSFSRSLTAFLSLPACPPVFNRSSHFSVPPSTLFPPSSFPSSLTPRRRSNKFRNPPITLGSGVLASRF